MQGRRILKFAGSDSGKDTAARLYGLVRTCRIYGTEPRSYLRHALECIAAIPSLASLKLALHKYAIGTIFITAIPRNSLVREVHLCCVTKCSYSNLDIRCRIEINPSWRKPGDLNSAA